VLLKGLREGFTEIGTCELGFEGCTEVHQVETYNPREESNPLLDWEKEVCKYEGTLCIGVCRGEDLVEKLLAGKGVGRHDGLLCYLGGSKL
jgi:hypothetical protein